MKYLVINPDFSTYVLEDPQLPDLQTAVKGYIEGIPLRNGDNAYINEEGKLKALELNLAGSLLFQDNMDDFIVGPMIIVGKPEGEEYAGLSDVEIDVYESYVEATDQNNPDEVQEYLKEQVANFLGGRNE